MCVCVYVCVCVFSGRTIGTECTLTGQCGRGMVCHNASSTDVSRCVCDARFVPRNDNSCGTFCSLTDTVGSSGM